MFLNVGHLTVSQNTSFFKEERTITYEKLNELYKFVKYKEVADEIIRLDSIQMDYLEDVISSMRDKESFYETEIKLLNERINIKDKQVNNREYVISVLEENLSKEQKVKWKYGFWGVVGGIVAGVLIGFGF